MGLLEIGQLVTSRMGRDFGRQYVVFEVYEDGHVSVVDGLARKVNRPKRKNVKHLIVHEAILKAEELDDKAIRRFIELHCNEEQVGEEGLTDHGQG